MVRTDGNSGDWYDDSLSTKSKREATREEREGEKVNLFWTDSVAHPLPHLPTLDFDGPFASFLLVRRHYCNTGYRCGARGKCHVGLLSLGLPLPLPPNPDVLPASTRPEIVVVRIARLLDR